MSQTQIYTSVVAGQPRPVVYFLVDAMRFEMGVELAERLPKAAEVGVRHAVGVLPSITSIGMAALQPGASASFTVLEQGGKLGARIEDAFLPDLAARKKFAAARVTNLTDMTLDELLSLAPSKLTKKIEDAGETSAHRIEGEADPLLVVTDGGEAQPSEPDRGPWVSLRRVAAQSAWRAMLLVTVQVPAFAQGIDFNTRSFQGGPINEATVGQLTVKWVYQTVPDTGTANAAQGSISSTPAVDGRFVYFNDMSGFLTKLDRFTGKLVWRKNYVSDLSAPGFVVKSSRNTPYVKGDLVIVGSNMGLIDRLCRMTGGTPSALGCASGDGAIVLAINKNTGQVVWRAKAETHPSAKVTGSISGQGDLIFVPVGNWEEDWARAYPNIFVEPIDPASHYPCCSARGSLVAIDVKTGQIRWKRHTNIGNDPDHELPQELRALLGPKGSFGTSTYGHNPTVDVARRQVYVATAQTTTAPQVAQDCEQARRTSGNPNANIPGLPAGVTCNNLNEKVKIYANAMFAVDMDTGRVNWADRKSTRLNSSH